MAPRQVFPSDNWGRLCTTRQLFNADGSVSRKELCAPGELSEIAGGAPKSTFGHPTKITSAENYDAYYFSDVDEALDDDDDDDGLGLEPNCPRREFIPKRGVEIFVGGLTRSTRRDMLRDWFQHAGEVTEVRIARDKRRRRCRGYGYVRFATSEQANRAIELMHRYEFKHGRFLGVLPSDENRTLFVGGLREEWTCAYITALLKERMTGLRKVEPIPDREDRMKIRTFCFLEFGTHEEAAAVFNRHQVDPLPAQQQQPGHPSRSSLCQEKMSLSDAAASTPKGQDSSSFERETRMNSGGTASISGSSGGVGDCSGGCHALLPDGAEGSVDCLTPPSAQTVPSDPAAVGGGRRAPGVALQPGAESVLGDSYGACESKWWRSIEDLDGGDVENASDHRTTSKANDDGESFAVWEKPAEGQDRNRSGGQPLVVDGAVLKVDWADPLRYHIHLNGGIKGPSAAPPEVRMPDGRSTSRGVNGSGASVRGPSPVVSGRESFSQGPWQNSSKQLLMVPMTRGRSGTDHALVRRTELQQHQHLQHQFYPQQRQLQQQQEVHHANHLYVHHYSTTPPLDCRSGRHHRSRSPQRVGSYGCLPATSQSILSTKDPVYAISGPRVSDGTRSSPFYRGGSSLAPLDGQQKQRDFGGDRSRIAQHEIPFSKFHLDEQEYGMRLPAPPDAVVAEGRRSRPSIDQFQLRSLDDRSRSTPGDGEHRRNPTGWMMLRDADVANAVTEGARFGGVMGSRGHCDVSRLVMPTYGASPEASAGRHQGALPYAPGGNGAGGETSCSHMETFPRGVRCQRTSVASSSAARRGSQPLPSSWNRRMMEDGAVPPDNAIMAVQSGRLEFCEVDPLVEREREDVRAAEGCHLHFGGQRSGKNETRGYNIGHDAQQQHRVYRRERWDQGWASEVGGHHPRQGNAQGRESMASCLSMFDRGSDRSDGASSSCFSLLHHQERRENDYQSEHAATSAGGILATGAPPQQQQYQKPSLQLFRGSSTSDIITGGSRVGVANRSSSFGEFSLGGGGGSGSGNNGSLPPGLSTTSFRPPSSALRSPLARSSANAPDRWAFGRDGGSDSASWEERGSRHELTPSRGSSGSGSISGSLSEADCHPSPDRAWDPLASGGERGVSAGESLGVGLWEAIRTVAEGGGEGKTQPSMWSSDASSRGL